eukprot:2853430-Pyramimonas_sp.AAC.1
MGYKAGEGLGRGGDGMVEPVALHQQDGRGGLGRQQQRERRQKEAEERRAKFGGEFPPYAREFTP